MIIDIVTLFPDMFKGPFEESIIKKAKEGKFVQTNIHDLRKWGIDKRGTVDDRPYGGGVGMILRPEPIFKAVEALGKEKAKVVLLDPVGKPYTQKKARQLAKEDHLILICGHYEGVDHRVHKYLVDEVVSIGDYVLTGGEIPAMVIVDSIVRLIPGVLEKEATQFESFSSTSLDLEASAMDKKHHVVGFASAKKRLKGVSFVKEDKKAKTKTIRLLECPQYTRPQSYKGHKVPKILLSGNHQEIAKWRLEQALKRTRCLRPDLLKES